MTFLGGEDDDFFANNVQDQRFQIPGLSLVEETLPSENATLNSVLTSMLSDIPRKPNQSSHSDQCLVNEGVSCDSGMEGKFAFPVEDWMMVGKVQFSLKQNLFSSLV